VIGLESMQVSKKQEEKDGSVGKNQVKKANIQQQEKFNYSANQDMKT
jgi:hypothetical protein